MALHSMTGFARSSRSFDGGEIIWELRSVNGKGLEMRLRLPPGSERLEPGVRQAIQKRFTRGNMQATLTLSSAGGMVQPVVNDAFLRDLAGLARRLQEQYGVAPASADGLLALRGVLEIPENQMDDDARCALDVEIMNTLDQALGELAQSRAREGGALGEVLLDHIDEIEKLTAEAEADPSRSVEAIRARLTEQVRLLTDAAPALDEARLHAEAAFIATKADIREELDRLQTHVTAARAMLAEGGPVGRRLDFLAQEFNRESNTLCSKSNAAAITAIGLALKVVVDQFREQVQNLE